MDIAKLKQFYCDIVGLRDGWRPPFKSRGHWLYAGPHPVVHLVEGEMTWARHREPASTTSPSGAPTSRRWSSDCGTAGIVFELTQVPSLGDQQLLFRDPLGIGVELPPPAGSS